MNELRDAACTYAVERRWRLFPCYPRIKQPHGLLVPQGYKEASANPSDILYWWEREPEANIGLSCRASGLVIIDIDPRNGGDDSFWELVSELGDPRTLTAETATGGRHLFFNDAPGLFKREVAPGVDIKSNGYVLLAPSVRYMGEYAWDEEIAVADLPTPWLGRMLQTGPQRHAKAPLTPSDEPLLAIPASEYINVLTGRDEQAGWVQCPFHKEGNERTPSLKVDGSMWSCFACEPMMGKDVLGGNIVDFAGILWGYAMPLRGIDLREVMDRLHGMFEPL